MTLHRLGFLVFSVLPLASAAMAQDPPRRDPQAVVLLAQMSRATGWNRQNAPMDILATGVFIRYRGDQQDALGLTMKAKGARRFRIDLQEGTGRSSIFKENHGAAISAEGVRRIPPHVVASEQPWVFPFLTDLAATNDTAISLSYIGVEDVRGEAAHRVDIYREPPVDHPAREDRRKAVAVTLWVSVARGVPVQIQSNLFAFDNPTSTFPTTRYLSDYRLVGGILVPFRQEQFIDGELRFVFQLARVDFNAGLADSDFDVPTGQD